MDGNILLQTSDYKFKSKKKIHNVWNGKIFREVFIPEGVLKIKVILDEKTYLEKKVKVTYKDK